MKKFLMVVASLFLCACAHQPTVVTFDLPEEAQSISVPIEDLRPESEKIKHDVTFSTILTSRSYGIARVGDQTTSPPMMDVFRWMVYERLNGTEKDLNISVYHMVAYLNVKSRARRSAIGFGLGGLIGATIAFHSTVSSVNISQALVDRDLFESTNKPNLEARRAFYSPEENPKNAPVFVIYIDAAVNDKRIFVRTMAPSDAPEGQFSFVLAVKGAIQFWLDQYSGGQDQ
ncbi:MAG: hypothetical protein FWH56_12880 [Betaproteobacteria bacterium]|nr:hypothetical protein [Betaproteobacteria bacterium]